MVAFVRRITGSIASCSMKIKFMDGQGGKPSTQVQHLNQVALCNSYAGLNMYRRSVQVLVEVTASFLTTCSRDSR